MTEQYDATALLAIPSVREGDTREQGLKRVERPFLIDQIRQKGVDVSVARGNVSIDAENGMALNVTSPLYDADGEVTLIEQGDVKLESFGVVRNIIAPRNLDMFTRQLNPFDLRMAGRNKNLIASEFLVPNGAYDRKIALVTDNDPTSIHDAIASLPGDFLVAKPNSGMRSNGVMVGTKAQIEVALKDIDKPYLIEEKLDFSAPVPSVRGFNEEEQKRLDYANATGVNKELRLYYFGAGVWDGVLRVAKEGELDFKDDKWLYIDMASVPQELIEKGDKVMQSVKDHFGTDEATIAFDWAFASSASSPEPHWQIMEMNAGDPQLVTRTEHHETGTRHYSKLATQIARVAVR